MDSNKKLWILSPLEGGGTPLGTSKDYGENSIVVDRSSTNIVIHNPKEPARCASCGLHQQSNQKYFCCKDCGKDFCQGHFKEDMGLCEACATPRREKLRQKIREIFLSNGHFSPTDQKKLEDFCRDFGLPSEALRVELEKYRGSADMEIWLDLQARGIREVERGKVAKGVELFLKIPQQQLAEAPQLVKALEKLFRFAPQTHPKELRTFLAVFSYDHTPEKTVAEYCLADSIEEGRKAILRLRGMTGELPNYPRLQAAWLLSEIEDAIDNEGLHEKREGLLSQFSDLESDLEKETCAFLKKLLVEAFGPGFPSFKTGVPSNVLESPSDGLGQKIFKISQKLKLKTSNNTAPDTIPTEKKEEGPQSKPETYGPLFLLGPEGQKITLNIPNIIGRGRLKEWGSNYTAMSLKQFEVFREAETNAWMIRPCAHAKRPLYLNGKLLTDPQKLEGEVWVALDTNGFCKVRILAG